MLTKFCCFCIWSTSSAMPTSPLEVSYCLALPSTGAAVRNLPTILRFSSSWKNQIVVTQVAVPKLFCRFLEIIQIKDSVVKYSRKTLHTIPLPKSHSTTYHVRGSELFYPAFPWLIFTDPTSHPLSQEPLLNLVGWGTLWDPDGGLSQWRGQPAPLPLLCTKW